MALTVDNLSTDRVNFGSAAALDNLTAFTFILWFKPANITVEYKGVITKFADTYLQGWTIYNSDVGSGGVLWLDVNDSVNYGRIQIASTASFTASAWNFGVWTVDHATAGNNNVYRGTLTDLVASIKDAGNSVYAAPVSYNDAANSLKLAGTIQTNDATAFGADYAFVGLWNRVLTLGEIQAQQFRPYVTNGCVLFTHLGYAGTGTQPDWSGNGNNGTPTGVTVANHVPLRPVFSGSRANWRGINTLSPLLIENVRQANAVYRM